MLPARDARLPHRILLAHTLYARTRRIFVREKGRIRARVSGVSFGDTFGKQRPICAFLVPGVFCRKSDCLLFRWKTRCCASRGAAAVSARDSFTTTGFRASVEAPSRESTMLYFRARQMPSGLHGPWQANPTRRSAHNRPLRKGLPARAPAKPSRPRTRQKRQAEERLYEIRCRCRQNLHSKL